MNTTSPSISSNLQDAQRAQHTSSHNTHMFNSVTHTSPLLTPETAKLDIRNLNFYYGQAQALKNINMIIPENRITALIGPSGCGKSTLLRVFNRIYDIYPKLRAEGEVLFDGQNILSDNISVNELRAKIGMVFQNQSLSQ
jgi:phosphate transport system ATP-binding protein